MPPVRAGDSPVTAAMSAGDAFDAIARSCLAHYEANRAGCCASSDPRATGMSSSGPLSVPRWPRHRRIAASSPWRDAVRAWLGSAARASTACASP
ncbi:MAG: hypothetical protein O3A06_10750 [Proteobacteria bacterium]|nr:hypothetical protein [Pseudomonadota bacterium]MDA0983490.1 hypothetical protein [Pseudomonadota bacterium]